MTGTGSGVSKSGNIEILRETYEIVAEKSYPVTTVSGGGGGGSIYSSFGGYTSGSISPIHISSSTVHHQALVLRNESGREESLRLEDSPVEFREGGRIAMVRLKVKGWVSTPFYALYSLEQDTSLVRDDMFKTALKKAGMKVSPFSSMAGLVLSFVPVAAIGILLAGAVMWGLQALNDAGILADAMLYSDGGDGYPHLHWLLLAFAPLIWVVLRRVMDVPKVRAQRKTMQQAISGLSKELSGARG